MSDRPPCFGQRDCSTLMLAHCPCITACDDTMRRRCPDAPPSWGALNAPVAEDVLDYAAYLAGRDSVYRIEARGSGALVLMPSKWCDPEHAWPCAKVLADSTGGRVQILLGDEVVGELMPGAVKLQRTFSAILLP